MVFGGSGPWISLQFRACPPKELKAMTIAEEKEMLELESIIEENGLTGRALLSDLFR